MLKIFLAHAKEDEEAVISLYRKLKDEGYRPWLDKENLLPGQNWRSEIPRAIKSSQVFIACLSQSSVAKQGYVQREFRMALNEYANRPHNTIYFIPIRLDDCSIPDLRQEEYGVNLRDIHWVDLFRPEGYGRLLKALEHVSRKGSLLQKQAASELPFKREERDSQILQKQAASELSFNHEESEHIIDDSRQSRNLREIASTYFARLLLAVVFSGIVFGLILFGMGIFNRENGPALEGEPLALTVNEPVIEIAEADDGSVDTSALAPDDAAGIARATINQWLEAKKASYSSDYDTSGLNSILTGTLLNETQDDIDLVKSEDVYVEFESELVEVLSVDPEDATDADTIVVQAEVVESKDVFRSGQFEEAPSFTNDVVSATYELVRQGDNWLIRDIR